MSASTPASAAGSACPVTAGLDLNDKFGAIGATAMTKAAGLHIHPAGWRAERLQASWSNLNSSGRLKNARCPYGIGRSAFLQATESMIARTANGQLA